MDRFFENTTINNICASITFFDKLNENFLKQTIYNIVRKNDAFRIRIDIQDGNPVQFFSEFEPFEIEIIIVKNNKDIENIKQGLINYKFNILNSDLFCFKIAKKTDGTGILIFTVHHMIADSWSLGLFSKNIFREYNALTKNKELPEMNNSYIEYINAEENYKQSKKYELDKKYWNELFETIPEQATIPSINTNINSYNANRETINFDFETTKKIKNFCEENKISVFNFLMAIYAIYIGRVSKLDDFVIRNTYFKSYKL